MGHLLERRKRWDGRLKEDAESRDDVVRPSTTKRMAPDDRYQRDAQEIRPSYRKMSFTLLPVQLFRAACRFR